MSVPVVMPQLGLTMTEGSVSEWLKKPGDMVRKGEMLFIVSTDKADMEVESLDEGHLAQIVVEPGNVVPVGTVIAYLGEAGETVAASAPAVSAPTPAAVPAAGAKVQSTATPAISSDSSPAREGGLPSSPRARKLARELGVDIAKVPPSGGRDRIVEEDVRAFAAAGKSQPKPSQVPDERRRRVIAERLTESIQTIPHFSLSLEIRADKLIALRESVKTQIEQQTGKKVTVTDFLLKALALACRETPQMCFVWKDGSAQKAAAIDLGLAIAADSGLVAPLFRNPAGMDLAALARRRTELIEMSRVGRLSLADLEGGIGTLSNLGGFRVDRFNAIINPGQTFILAAGKIAQRPWVEAGGLFAAHTLNLTLSVDHRVADGALAAQFLEKIAAGIEDPGRLVAPSR